MLTKTDEFPFHQTADTFAAVLSGDKHWNDGHYICLCDDEGKVSLIGTVRLYQNNDVLDGFLCLRHEGKQHNIRVSRRLRPDVDHYGAGPLRIEIVEPMKTIRLVLEDNDYGISCDVLCHSVAVPYESPTNVLRVDGRLLGERITYEVAGRAEGHVTVEGNRYELAPDRSGVFRNHSWGFMRGRGGPDLHGAPPPSIPRRRGLRNWVLYVMPDHAGFYEFVEDDEGRQWSGAHQNIDGTPVPMTAAILLPDRRVEVTGVTHDLTFYEGTSRLKGGRFAMTDETGTRREFEVEDLGWIYCQGGGYFDGFNDGLGQGVYRGEYHEEGEVWDCSQPVTILDAKGDEVQFNSVWAESFTRLRSGGDTGLAHFESVAFGPYARYGFTGQGGG